ERWLADGCDVVLDIDWQGARQVRDHVPDAILVFIRPPSLNELERRLRARGSEDEDSIARRLDEAEAELGHAGEYDYQITNDRFDDALAELQRIFDDGAAATGHGVGNAL